MVKSNITTDYLGAVFQEGADKLTLRAREEGVLRILSTPLMWDTKKRWKPPLVDLDWHAFCQDIFQGVEGPEWDAMFSQYEDLHQVVKSKKSGEHRKAKVLWTMIETKNKGMSFCDAGHEKENKTRAHFRLQFWATIF